MRGIFLQWYTLLSNPCLMSFWAMCASMMSVEEESAEDLEEGSIEDSIGRQFLFLGGRLARGFGLGCGVCFHLVGQVLGPGGGGGGLQVQMVRPAVAAGAWAPGTGHRCCPSRGLAFQGYYCG